MTTNKNCCVLVGRANVGKSTLFNCFSANKAIVFDQPGVTRDCKTSDVAWGGFHFTLVDTPGLDAHTSILSNVVNDAALVLFVVDGVSGVLPGDRMIANQIRHKPVVVLVNKCDRKHFGLEDFYALGFEHVLPVSAAHRDGLSELVPFFSALSEEDVETENIDRIIVMGRQNVGKSTFINAVLGEDRQLTGETPGLTRDSVEFKLAHHPLVLVDTAGMRKGSSGEDIEKMSIAETQRCMNRAQGVIYLADALTHLDQQMIHKILDEGRCICVGLSKWDLAAEESHSILREVMHRLHDRVPVVPVSSFNGIGMHKIISVMQHVLSQWKTKIPTSKLNQVLQGDVKYVTQVKARPPTFRVFTKRSNESYQRFIMNKLVAAFDWKGVPLRLQLQKYNTR